MMARKRKTNVEFVRDAMEFSDYGALAQVFALQAIERYARAVVAAPDEDIGDESLIQPKAWKGAAQEWLDRLDAHYKG